MHDFIYKKEIRKELVAYDTRNKIKKISQPFSVISVLNSLYLLDLT